MGLGLISIFPGICLFPFGFSVGIVGLIVSIIEDKRISKGLSPKSNLTLVRVGFWSSFFAVIICGLVLIGMLIDALV